MQLGIVTNTGDAEGEIIARNSVNVSLELIQLALGKFIGEINQIPPMYSALKHNGQPLYEYARAGITIERQSRKVSIYELELINYDAKQQLEFRALVSKGTYIRTLAEDIGNFLGSGASLIALRRTRTNQFSINAAITIEEIAENISNLPLLPIDSILPDLNSYQINDEQYIKVGHGNVCKINECLKLGKYRLYYQSKFLGVADIIEDNGGLQLRPKRMIQQTLIN
jgi:tRNA pseudouridine55 synthase